MLADEPIASLDPLNARLVMDALADINRRDGITVLTNLHTLDTARTYCRRIIGMSAGRIVFDGAPEALTDAVLREIYGHAGAEPLDERLTSTSLRRARSPPWRGRMDYREAAACSAVSSSVWPSPRRVLLAPLTAHAQDWKSQVKEFRIGLLGGENTSNRLARYDGFQHLLQQKLGVPVKLFPAADYAGVMQAIAAGQLEVAEFGPSAFAGAWLDCKCVEPIVVPLEKDGTVFYISVMLVRKDSGITSIEQMKGHSLAWADPNSTSGYLIPSATLKARAST